MEEIEILIGLLKQKMHEKKPSAILTLDNNHLPELTKNITSNIYNNFDNNSSGSSIEQQNGKFNKNSFNGNISNNNNKIILPLLQNNREINDNENNSPKLSKLNFKEVKNDRVQTKLYPFVLKDNSAEEKNGLTKGKNHIVQSDKLFTLDCLKNTLHNKIKEKENKEIEEENEKNNNIKDFQYDSMRYLDFRPYIDDMDQKLKTPKDLGYYYKMIGGDCKLIKNTLEDNGFKETISNNYTLLWSSGTIKQEVYKSLKKYQKINHFPKSKEITRKDFLYKSICKLQTHSKANQKDFNFLPESYILPNEHKFLQESMEKDPNCIWIIKPVASSQGKGIFVTNKIVDIPSGLNLIVSKYIFNPFLIDGFKFDIRIYVMITSIMPLRIYIYDEGLVRFATEKYFIGQPFKNNRFMHLTNYSLNKNSKNFIANNDPFMDNVGSKWSLSALKSLLEKQNINTKEIFEKIDDIVIKTILSAEDTISNQLQNICNIKNSCFELFGFDILLDSNLNPWLLEVNLSPSMNCDSPLDQKIKSELISECFNLIRIVPFYMKNQETEFINGDFDNREIEKKILKETTHLDIMKDFKINKENRELLWEGEEEIKRLKNFRRIFPNFKSLNYRKFFYNENPINLFNTLYCMEKNENRDIDQFRKFKKLNLKNFVKK